MMLSIFTKFKKIFATFSDQAFLEHDTYKRQIILLVYKLRAQNLNFVVPMPEQIGTLTVHFPKVSGGTYLVHFEPLHALTANF